MSHSRLREIREKLGQLNTEVQEYRKKINNRATSKADKDAALESFNRAMNEVDVLTAERDEITAANEREARASQLERDVNGSTRPPADADPTEEGSAHVQIYNRALRRHGVIVTKRGGQMTFRNVALEQVHSDVRQTIEDLNERYFRALRQYFLATCYGDPNRASSEARDIVFGRNPEFRGFLSGDSLNDKERRDMGIGTLGLGGYFVPKGFVYDVEEALKYYGPMLNTSEIMDTATGQPLPYPTDNDTTVMGQIVGEGQQTSETDVSIGQVLFGAIKFSSRMVKVSIELLQDSAFDMELYLKKKLAIRMGRIYNNQFTVGAGPSGTPPAPNGIVPAAVAACGTPSLTPWTGANNGYGIPLIASGAATNDGGSETGGTSIGSIDLDNLEHTVDPLYRRGAGYMLHDQTLRRIKVLLDKYGRPLWKPGVSSGDPDTINSYPYHINNDMAICPAVAQNPGPVTVLFGALDKYVIRRVKELGIITLRERFADYGQIAVLGFSRADGQLLDAGTHPVCYLIQATS